MSFDTDALTVWINGFFALAAISTLFAVAALVMLRAGSRSTARPTPQRSAARVPSVSLTGPIATDPAT